VNNKGKTKKNSSNNSVIHEMKSHINGLKEQQVEMKNNLAIFNVLNKNDRDRKRMNNPPVIVEEVKKRHKSVEPTKAKPRTKVSNNIPEKKGIKYLVR